jgi:hypothetical protein
MYVATYGRGLGDQQAAQQAVQLGAAGASAAVSAAVAAGLIGTAAILFSVRAAGVAIQASVLIGNWVVKAHPNFELAIAAATQKNSTNILLCPCRGRGQSLLALQTFDQIWQSL